jgi:putative ABC transport system substrate-binding protein
MRLYVEEGCLMTYSADLTTMFRNLAAPTARILRGARPSETPLEQPREFDLVINMKTAKELGLTIPLSVRIQTTEAIK